MKTLLLLTGIIVIAPSVIAQELSPRDIAATVRPAVVVVNAIRAGEAVGQGSGFLVSPDGLIVTNRHVVEGAESLEVELASGEIFDNVYVLSDDERRDLVVLQIPGTGLPSLTIGDERQIQVGDPVFVMGSPRGLEGTFSDGIVSAKRLVAGVSLLQVTAPISPGSSGGPVLDVAATVIGVATLFVEDGQNLNLAVPARYAAGLLNLPADPRPFEVVAGQFATPETEEESEDLEPWAQVLVDEMERVQRAAAELGFVSSHEPYVDMLDEGELHEIDYSFDTRGDHVTVIAVCDLDCRDLDLGVFDASGEAVASDVTVTDRPEVRFQVLRPGVFQVRVLMSDCRVEPCGYVVQAYIEPK